MDDQRQCSLVEVLHAIAFRDEFHENRVFPYKRRYFTHQLFATGVGSRWQCLESLLSLTSQDIESVKNDTNGASPTKQALCICYINELPVKQQHTVCYTHKTVYSFHVSHLKT